MRDFAIEKQQVVCSQYDIVSWLNYSLIRTNKRIVEFFGKLKFLERADITSDPHMVKDKNAKPPERRTSGGRVRAIGARKVRVVGRAGVEPAISTVSG